MSLPKVTILGAGQVGATTAHLLVLKGLADVVLIDVVEGLAAGKALDLLQAAAIEELAVSVTGTTDMGAMAGSRLVVITAGLARKPGMSRDDLLAANANIVGPLADQIARVAPEAVVIVVTNPLDVMTQLVLQRTGFPRQRVMGMAGMLDTGRLRAFISQRLTVSPSEVQAVVLGSHGDLMVCLTDAIRVQGAPLSQRLSSQEIDQLVARARDGGAEIVSLLKTSSAYYAPASGVVHMISAVLGGTRRVLSACVLLEGEYGLRDVCIGVPVEVGTEGIARVVEQPLSPQAREALHRAADQVRAQVKQLLTLKPR
ncbi:MAG TPA: malate dehydrogenase [Candidatus Omnitrophica bacterium]|nr:MAG: malate dehydrogenase [Omnitrophica WOR_2 bacterium GWA2_63_20]OGX16842.1 MAG: malate dehydrogenase [Omnitrophica WOR_2 bacterium GWF2_63_9]OGX32152.1 MAG: malate dehydrogenase [Omnitrophica WOR_2 bacterium RIFCSPHIGHO2_12_FULL_64_13]OGX35122.1 MAG: malate dehydrogenase [Omnitrophica WOR_2 bacterium RIFCSPHIGHO2_02_FULL_63_39]OGX45595.1 MAG: malate dehydrogenase [Omnitrophica WOR_2 bacterium RIFCSPLOWO2_02_FULL_63_16]OGX48477.1 MAG: malate dehydrogenase [Omnitrophica WOR_2 bacterium RIF